MIVNNKFKKPLQLKSIEDSLRRFIKVKGCLESSSTLTISLSNFYEESRDSIDELQKCQHQCCKPCISPNKCYRTISKIILIFQSLKTTFMKRCSNVYFNCDKYKLNLHYQFSRNNEGI